MYQGNIYICKHDFLKQKNEDTYDSSYKLFIVYAKKWLLLQFSYF